MAPPFPFNMPTYARDMLRRVEDLSGKAILVQEVENLGHDSEARCATEGMRMHEILYRPEYRLYGLHFFVNACAKFIRVLEAKPSDRTIAASDPTQCLPAGEHFELARNTPGLSVRMLEEASRYLRHGLVRQLTSFPVDLRVERELKQELPDHRSLQQAYLLRQIYDLEEHFSPELARWAPKQTYAASTAMNHVLVDVAANLAETRTPQWALEAPARDKGLDLYSILQAEKQPGLAGDHAVVDAWAQELNMTDWYQWARLAC